MISLNYVSFTYSSTFKAKIGECLKMIKFGGKLIFSLCGKIPFIFNHLNWKKLKPLGEIYFNRLNQFQYDLVHFYSLTILHLEVLCYNTRNFTLKNLFKEDVFFSNSWNLSVLVAAIISSIYSEDDVGREKTNFDFVN